MPRVKSVISLGVGGQTQGAWTVPAKAMGYFGSTEGRAYTVAYGLSYFIESRFLTRSIYCPPDLDNEEGPRVPIQSLKLHAELAGIGARSPATYCCTPNTVTCTSRRCSPSWSYLRTNHLPKIHARPLLVYNFTNALARRRA